MEYKYQGNFLQVKEEKIDGQVFEKAYYKHSVISYPINSSGKILFIKERRIHETPTVRIKPVTGFIEKGLTWQENTQKELQEEINFRAGELFLFHHYVATGGFNTQKYFSIASNLSVSSIKNPDGDVIEEIIPYRLEEAISKSLSGEIKMTADSMGLFILFHRNDLREKYGF